MLVDDAFPVGTDEDPRQTVPPALGRHPGLFRPPIHEHDPRRSERRHPTRQDPRPRLQEHGLLLHNDLPDLRQTRPQHRHHLTHFTHTKQRKAIFDGLICDPPGLSALFTGAAVHEILMFSRYNQRCGMKGGGSWWTWIMS